MNIGRTFQKMHSQVRREPGIETIALDADELFAVLADSRRRAVLDRLADGHRDPPTCAELAVEIAAAETHMERAVVPPRRVQPVEDNLRSEHLPRLAEAGLLHWNEDAGTVRPGHSVDAIASLLDEIDRRVQREPTLPSSPWYTPRSVDSHGTQGTIRFGPPT